MSTIKNISGLNTFKKDKIESKDLYIRFLTRNIDLDTHSYEVRGIISLELKRIGFIEMYKYNFAQALDDGYYWGDLIDDSQEHLETLEPLIDDKSAEYSEEFLEILDKYGLWPESLFLLDRIILKKEYRGNKLSKSIFDLIQIYNNIPLVMVPFPLQHSNMPIDHKRVGIKGKKADHKKDKKSLEKYYESLGFIKVGTSDTYVFI